jgi:protein TonB
VSPFLLLLIHAMAPPGADTAPQGIEFTQTGTAPRRIKGSLKDRDFPERLMLAASPTSALLRYSVGLDGRVTHCRAVEHSSDRRLEEIACDLIVKRYRFRPARDAAEHEIVADIVERQSFLPAPSHAQ